MSIKISFYLSISILYFHYCTKKDYQDENSGCYVFYNHANKAYCSFLSHDYKSSIFYYKKAFDLRPEGCNVASYRNDHYIMAKSLINLKRYEQSKKHIENAIYLGGLKWDEITKDSLGQIIIDKNIITKKRYYTIETRRAKKIDQKLLDIVDTLSYNDQYYRLMVKNFPESKTDSLRLLQKQIDTENERELKHLIDSIGYPGFEKTGTDKIDLVMMHTSKKFRDLMFPSLLKEVDKGNVNPDIIGMMIDQQNVLNGKRLQKFGYFFEFNEIKEKFFMSFLKSDLDSINKDRKEIGAIPIECSAIKNKAKLPINFDWSY